MIALILSASLVMAGARHAPAPIPSSSPTHVEVTIDPGPALSGTLRVQFIPVDSYTTPAERAKIYSAGKKMNEVVQSQCFHDFMAKRALIQTNSRTAAQVADHLQGLVGVVPVKFYYTRFSSAVAYRQPPSMTINLNRKFLGANTPDCDLAATEAHESLGHSLGGYDHAYKWNPTRDYSVPYSMGGSKAVNGGDAFKACCK